MANLRANKITTGTADYQGSIYASGVGAFLRTQTTAPGTDDFTIECWLNSNDASDSTQEGVFAINGDADGFQTGSSNRIRLVQGRYGGAGQTGGLEVNINGTNVGTGNGNDVIAEGTWYHVAVTRASGTVKIWVDGVEKASGSAAGDVTGTTFITGYYDGNYTFQGYMSNFRYRKGTAHYTTTFTPPTGPLERTTDTELIFAQSAIHAGNGYSSAIQGGTTNIMQVNGNVSANTQAPTQTLTTTSDVGVVFDGDPKFNTQGVMYFPTGDTSQRGRGRGLIACASSPSDSNTVEYVEIQSGGTAKDFGDLSASISGSNGACSSSTRGLFAGGWVNPANSNVIEYFTIATTGNATDFGDMTVIRRGLSGCGNDTRGLFTGGRADPGANPTDVIDYVTIATTGNATDFGNLSLARRYLGATSNTTRGLSAGGYDSSPGDQSDVIDYVTIASTGNATDFGNLTTARDQLEGNASSTRGLFGGGANSPTFYNTIDYITIASTGNATDFGDLINTKADSQSASNSLRGIWAGGATPTKINTISFVNIASTGNANRFGDLTVTGTEGSGCSDSHGGLS